MKPLDDYPPTRPEALARIAAVRPIDYARSRNALDGAVTRLSPYIAHGFVSLPEVLAGVASRHRLDVQHKFVYELGWREYFRHVWRQRGDAILQSLHEGLLPDGSYCSDLPADIREARTGVPVVDMAVRTLYATGTLHNHARMWLASYVVHLRKVHWRVGADWLVAHLLDGDLASNHLNWQWVAGTGSSKPYLFNAENVARHAPASWHSAGSVVDQSYEALESIARDARPVATELRAVGVEEPALRSVPCVTEQRREVDVAGRDVWLVHPWALGEPPHDLPDDCLSIGWWPAEHHDAWPWSDARWEFAGTRMAALTTCCWHVGCEDLIRKLAGARSVQMLADPHVGRLSTDLVIQRPSNDLFADVDRPCTSFSSWWTRTLRGATTLSDLPGMAALAASRPQRR